MAVHCELRLPSATREQCLGLEQRVEQRLAATGRPPDGLMFLCVHPIADGARIDRAFRTEAEARAELDGHLRADAAAVGLDLGNPSFTPVWSIALPGAAR